MTNERTETLNFQQMNIKPMYRSSDYSNIGRDFIEKVLEHCVSYKRAVGFFSSTSLIYTSHGLLNIADHYKGGDPLIRFIVSPKLTKEDEMAIRAGIRSRNRVIENAMLRDFSEPENEFGKERLNILCHLISSGAMEIKVAVTMFEENDIGMYHDKIGIMEDEDYNKIAFSGSLNESANAFANNFESITVFKSWEETRPYLDEIEKDFDLLWTNLTDRVLVIDFPEAVKQRLFQYKRETFNRNIEEDERKWERQSKSELPSIKGGDAPQFYDYQKEAITNWMRNRGRGIFDMATGTGKTFTAYGAMVALLERTKYHLATVIVCPYQHLVDQWIEDAERFKISNMIVGYSDPKYKDYMTRLKQAIQNYNDGIINFFYFITTNASYKTDKVQEALKKINGNALLVADEAHNLGSVGMVDCLLPNFNFRLALSATVDRFRDEEGTKQIYDYFGQKCIEYPLEKAIDEGKLTKYYYYPIIVYLTQEERLQYLELTKKLAKLIRKDKNGKQVMSEGAQQIAIQRSHIIAGAENKLYQLKAEMRRHINDYYMLVYCGTSVMAKGTNDEKKQIDAVSSMLGNDLKIRCAKYTSEENAEERRELKRRFQTGDDLQALVAIKCLDEGVNIPNIRKAFILASSTNPREYIQRRGRVLRLAEGKGDAEIYDFVCLPLDATELQESDKETRKSFKALINNELKRIEEFGKHAINNSESDTCAEKIREDYDMYDFETGQSVIYSEEE